METETTQAPPSEDGTARRIYKLREVRYRMQSRLWSALSETERAAYAPKLQAMIDANNADVTPPGGWTGGPGAQHDTMLVLLDGRLLAAVVMRSVPVLDPLILDPSLDGNLRAVVFEMAVRRAEGVVQGAGAASYFFGVSPEVADDFCILLAGKEGTAEWKRDAVRFFRRLL